MCRDGPGASCCKEATFIQRGDFFSAFFLFHRAVGKINKKQGRGEGGGASGLLAPAGRGAGVGGCAERPAAPVASRPVPAPRFPRCPPRQAAREVSVGGGWVSAPWDGRWAGGPGRRSVGPRQGEEGGGGAGSVSMCRTGKGGREEGRRRGGGYTRGQRRDPFSTPQGGNLLLPLPPPPFSPFLLLLSPKLNFLLPARLGRGRGARPDSAPDTHNSWSCQNFLRSASAPTASAAACSSSAPGGSARGEGAGPVYNEAAAAAAGQRRSRSRRQLPGPLRGGGAPSGGISRLSLALFTSPATSPSPDRPR